MPKKNDQNYAELYDPSVPDWPGEIEFYLDLASRAAGQGGSVLEVACGTGRVALRLAGEGFLVSGVDLSEAMLTVARRKTDHEFNPRWTQGDMRDFDLAERFALAIIPGHSFQYMLTPHDQLRCLLNIRKHLRPGGRLLLHLDHQDLDWLGALGKALGGVFEPAAPVFHLETGRMVHAYRAWNYERPTQIASVTTRWEELDESGEVVESWLRGPTRLHCAFRFEIEHLLPRAGFEIQALYGDFYKGILSADSSEMIFLARRIEE